MSIEAMKQALEVIEAAIESGDWQIDGACDPSMAIHSLYEAIAEAERPAHTDHPSRHWDRTCPACVYESDISQERVDEMAKHKREWVGLTDEEQEELLETKDWGGSLIAATEAKLKEKNS